jgi:hypothetical protein
VAHGGGRCRFDEEHHDGATFGLWSTYMKLDDLNSLFDIFNCNGHQYKSAVWGLTRTMLHVIRVNDVPDTWFTQTSASQGI